ncbi:MAG: hypothetical protein EOP64_01670 [Sphingomonas sp.]|nr:MAG: hypothetical protein EOP64_01670 [Sphingomonas sp.]
MGQVRHGSATTTHAVRAAIQRSQASLSTLMRRMAVSAMVSSWLPSWTAWATARSRRRTCSVSLMASGLWTWGVSSACPVG